MEDNKGIINSAVDSVKGFFNPPQTIVAKPVPIKKEEKSIIPIWPDKYDKNKEQDLHGLITALRNFKSIEEPEVEKVSDIEKFKKLKQLIKALQK